MGAGEGLRRGLQTEVGKSLLFSISLARYRINIEIYAFETVKVAEMANLLRIQQPQFAFIRGGCEKKGKHTTKFIFTVDILVQPFHAPFFSPSSALLCHDVYPQPRVAWIRSFYMRHDERKQIYETTTE